MCILFNISVCYVVCGYIYMFVFCIIMYFVYISSNVNNAICMLKRKKCLACQLAGYRFCFYCSMLLAHGR